MKEAIRITSLTLILSFLFLGAGVASEKDQFIANMKTKGINPMSADEITKQKWV